MGYPVHETYAAEPQNSIGAGSVAVVFKQASRYNTFVQGKFENFLKTKLIEFPMNDMSQEEILHDLKDYGLRVDYLVLVDLKETVNFQQTAARTGGKQGYWTSDVTGQVDFFDVEKQSRIVSRPLHITKQYDDRGSALGNALRSVAEKGLGDIYYYEQTPDQRILYWLSDRVKESLGEVLDGMLKKDVSISIRSDTIADRTMVWINPAKNLFENSLDYLADQIASRMEEKGKRTIAVTEFVWTDGSHHDLESYIAEELLTRVANKKGFTIVERALLDRAVQELKFNLSDLVDPDYAKQFGQVTGADTILVGTITNLSNKYKINCRLVDSENGTVYSAVKGAIYHDERLESLMLSE